MGGSTPRNTGNGAAASYQQVSVPTTTSEVPGYINASVAGQLQIAAQGATVDIGDSVHDQQPEMLGDDASQSGRETDRIFYRNLEAATQSQDATQQTIMATLQRINQACFCNSVPSRTRTR